MPAFQKSAWCFTENNPGLYDPAKMEGYRYLIYSEEVGEQGTPHIQGYVVFEKKVTLARLKELNPRAKWIAAEGDAQANKHYCSKPVDGCECAKCKKARAVGYRIAGPFEYGTMPQPGKRSDLLIIRDKLVAQSTKKQLYEEDTFKSMVMYTNGVEKARNVFIPERDFKTEVCVLYGDTGTGKTKFILQNLPSEKTYWLNMARTDGDPWWDGYDPIQHEFVVIDEYYGGIRWSTFLRLLDRAPMQVEAKGSKLEFRARQIYITSNKPPHEWYHKLFVENKAKYETLERRFNIVRRYFLLDQFVTIRHQFDE